MSEAELDGDNGRRLRLHSLESRGDELNYVATLELSEGHGSVTVYEFGTGLPRFVRSLADAWQGFDDVREYASLEGDLVLSCRHDGVGTVRCKVTVGRSSPPEWSMSAVLDFGAGAHLDRLAGEVESFFGADLPIGTLDSRPGTGHSAPVNDDDFERRLADLLATLDDASALLAKHGAQHWADWLSEDRERIANHDRHGLEHLLMAFGGMGSLKDLVFHPLNGNASGEGLDGWDNDELDAVRSKIFRNATALRRELGRS